MNAVNMSHKILTKVRVTRGKYIYLFCVHSVYSDPHFSQFSSVHMKLSIITAYNIYEGKSSEIEEIKNV